MFQCKIAAALTVFVFTMRAAWACCDFPERQLSEKLQSNPSSWSITGMSCSTPSPYVQCYTATFEYKGTYKGKPYSFFGDVRGGLQLGQDCTTATLQDLAAKNELAAFKPAAAILGDMSDRVLTFKNATCCDHFSPFDSPCNNAGTPKITRGSANSGTRAAPSLFMLLAVVCATLVAAVLGR